MVYISRCGCLRLPHSGVVTSFHAGVVTSHNRNLPAYNHHILLCTCSHDNIVAMASIYLVNALYNKPKAPTALAVQPEGEVKSNQPTASTERPAAADTSAQSAGEVAQISKQDLSQGQQKSENGEVMHPSRQQLVSYLGSLYFHAPTFYVTHCIQAHLRKNQNLWSTRPLGLTVSPWVKRPLLSRRSVAGARSNPLRLDELRRASRGCASHSKRFERPRGVISRL